MDGPTLVVSPLLALIEDQYIKLKAAGVAVVRIDSTRTAKERAADLAAVREGSIKLVMITPESVNTPTTQEALAGVKFSLFCVDEAHCVSQWGHDFRPSYLGLRRAAQVLGRPPILGLTATATPAIADDVLVQLGMKDPKVCRVSFHRPNLAFDVRKVAGEADKLRQLGKLIQRLRRPGIVYCATVRAVDELYVALRHGKIPVERYNGKMTTDEREKSQASFMQPGRKVVMLATNAFGLGIDKPDIRYIIHYQMPGLARVVRAGGGARGPRRQAGALRAAVPARRHRDPGTLPQGSAPDQDRRRAWWPRASTRGATRARKCRCATSRCRWRCRSGACASSCRCSRRWASPRRSRPRAGRASSRSRRASRSTRPRWCSRRGASPIGGGCRRCCRT